LGNGAEVFFSPVFSATDKGEKMKATSTLFLGLGAAFLVVSTAQAAESHQTPVAPAEYLEMENPIDLDDADDKFMKKVGRLYKNKCKKCHGTEGDGKGSAVEDMVIKPKALNAPGFLESRKDGQLFWIMKEGSEGTEMKAFGPGTDASLSEEELWKLIAFMRVKFTQ
jgi:mono/diheme cytochrome c family protein